MLTTAERLLRMLSLLQSPRRWLGSELAERLQVTGRTVRNDVERLRAMGYEIDATRGPAGGYRLQPGSAMPPLLLDDDEAVAIAVGLTAATSGSIEGIDDSANRALAKLEQILPARLRGRVSAIRLHTTALPGDSLPPSVAPETLDRIAAACRDRNQLRFDYTRHDGTEQRRVAEPHRIVSWGRRWYLVAWDVDRAGWRTFRIDRIALRGQPGPRFCSQLHPPDLDDLRAGVSSASWHYRTRAVVHAPAARIVERINPAVGHVEPLDGATCILHTGAADLDTLATHLGLLGVDFTVTGPPELVDRLADLARRYARACHEPAARASEAFGG